jgi:hypothetical protein
MSPTQRRLSLDPGEVRTSQVTVGNSGDVAFEARVYATTYQMNDDYTGNIFGGNEQPRTQISRWITFDGADATETFSLAPGEKRVVEFTVTVPESVPAGGQYGGIMAEVAPPADAGGIVAVRRVASLLLANVNGQTNDSGRVTSQRLSAFAPRRKVSAGATVQNSGNTDFGVENVLTIRNLFGGKVDEVRARSEIVFPDTSRDLSVNWPSIDADEDEADTDSVPRAPIGIYRVTLQTNFLDQTVETTKLVVVMPPWLIAATCLVLVVVGVVIVARGKDKHPKRKSTRYAKTK